MTDTFTAMSDTLNGYEQPVPPTATVKRLVCKFEPMAHGVFANPVALNRHYTSEHAHEYETPSTSRRVLCNLCDREVSKGNAGEHFRRMHRGTSHHGNYRELGEPNPHTAPQVDAAKVAQLDALPYDVRRNKKRRCLLCPYSTAHKNFSRHFATAHGRTRNPLEHSTWAEAIIDPDAPAVPVPAEVEPTQALEVVSPRKRNAPKLNTVGVELDTIWLGTIEALAYPHGVVPVQHMLSLAHWRDATRDMLDAVAGEGDTHAP